MSNSNEAIISFDEFSAKLTRKKFEELNSVLFDRVLKLIKDVLAYGNVEKSNVDEIILTGRSFYIPRIKQLIQDYFQDKRLFLELIDAKSVAMGAAYFAIRKKLVLDYFPFSVGVELKNNKLDWIIKNNSMLPNHDFKNYSLSSSFFKIPIYEHINSASKPYLLEDFTSDLPAPNSSTIELKLDLDLNGILKISVKFFEILTQEPAETTANANNSKYNHTITYVIIGNLCLGLFFG